jgi:transglutaminase-like putative cysteine protease
MRIAVVHSTNYRYSAPVYLEPHVIRLRPREDGSQRLNAFALDLQPAPAGMSTVLDQDGNTVVHAWFDGLTERLTILTSFQVETLRANPFDYLPLPSDCDVPVQYAEVLRNPLVPYLRADHHPDVRAFAQQIANEAGWNTADFLARLNRTLFETIGQIIRRDGRPHPPAVTLAGREGSCRDTAALFCAACRAMGIAARFVSGYEIGAAEADGGDLHAWAEVYLQGGGWRGFDPSRGLAVADSHVPVAAASDPLLAAPVTGTYRGEASARIEFSISMQV